MTKGNDFENCMMYQALVFAGNGTTVGPKDYSSLYASSDYEVKTESSKILDNIFIQLNVNNFQEKKALCSTFSHISTGRPTPKTDIIFKHGPKKYKCSLKWGNSFQSSSAGIETTKKFIEEIVKKTIKNNSGKVDITSMGEMVTILEQLDGFVGDVKIDTKQSMQSKMRAINQIGGLQHRLQHILGSTKNPDVSEIFYNFKKLIIKESLTGELLFGSRNDSSANYILTGGKNKFALDEINDSYVERVMGKSSARISVKGRKSVGPVRMQEVVIRIDMKD